MLLLTASTLYFACSPTSAPTQAKPPRPSLELRGVVLHQWRNDQLSVRAYAQKASYFRDAARAEMEVVQAHLIRSGALVTADAATSQTASREVSGRGHVRLQTLNGLVGTSEEASYSAQRGTRGQAWGNKPVTLSTPNGWVSGDAFQFDDGTQRLHFSGNVKSYNAGQANPEQATP